MRPFLLLLSQYMETDAPKISELRLAAMNYLAMREHSVQELKEKLARKYSTWPELIDSVVAQLAAEGLQCDHRFALAFIAMRQRQGKGSQLIRLELRERGVAGELINQCLDEVDPCWNELARTARTKRFGHMLPSDQRERAKQMRFLQARGFSSRHIQRAFVADVDDYS